MSWPQPVAIVLAAATILPSACSRPSGFSAENARAHVRALATTIGSRPTGSAANARARDYVVSELRRSGFDVRIQEADGTRPLYGASARVRNIIGTRPGRRSHSIALVTHYDSVPDGPGAADDALGVAVCLEAGRVLAQRQRPNYALALVFTDGEELGLMGASALLRDPIVGWIRAVLNFEAVGSRGPALMFEATPGAGALLESWKQFGWHQAGASFMPEIYRRLPADTDLTLFRRAGIPGVNFAPADDSYSYHTPNDTERRLSSFTLLHMGENAVAVAEALDRSDLSDPRATPATFFDIARARVVAYGTVPSAALLAVALVAALVAWVQTVSVALRLFGVVKIVLTAAWSILGIGGVAAFMLSSAWLVRASRMQYHPWYAHPDRYYLFLVLAGVLAGLTVARLCAWLPSRARGSTHPAAAWSVILPSWMVIATAAQLLAPSAAYLAVVPLAAAGVALAISSTATAIAARIAGAFVFVVSALLWAPGAWMLLHFVVPQLGRLPIITPLAVYPLLLLLCGSFLVPPLLATVSGGHHARSGGVFAFAVLLLAVLAAGAWCWMSPAYSDERPLQRTARYVADVALKQAYWEVGANEPGTGVGKKVPATGDWRPVKARFDIGTPLDRVLWPQPFCYRVDGASFEPSPVSATGFGRCGQDGCNIEIRALPKVPGATVIFKLPPGVSAEETNLPAVEEDGQFRAIYANVPEQGVTWRVRVAGRDAATVLAGARVIAVTHGVPGGAWPQLPGWLLRDGVTWHARSYFILPINLQ